MFPQHSGYLKFVAIAISLSHSATSVSALPQPIANGTGIIPIIATTSEYFPYENVVLTDVVTQDYPELSFDDVVYTDPESNNTISKRASLANLVCKILPADRSWPATTILTLVGLLTGQGLIQTVPLAAPCYSGKNYNAAKCADITARWSDSDLQYVPQFLILIGFNILIFGL